MIKSAFPKGFTDAAARVLKNHNWPGNVRELQNVVERAVILCSDNGMLEPEHLGLGGSSLPSSASVVVNGALEPVTHSQQFPTLADLEKHHIFAALDRCQGNRTHAAKLLDVSIRTLRNKLHEYNGTAPKSEADPELTEA